MWEGYREILLNNKAAVISWLSKWRRFVVVFVNTRANLSVERENRNSLLLPPAGNACGIHCILLKVCLTLAAGAMKFMPKSQLTNS